MPHARALGVYLTGLIASSALSFACSNDDGVGLLDRGLCDLLIDCATQLAPESRDSYLAAYGPAGTCWTGGPSQWQTCRDVCRQTLDAINLTAQLSGESCGTCMTDADCVSYGAGASCSAGYCVGAGGQASGESGGQEAGDGDGDSFADLTGVSILVVLDNSGSMGEEAAIVAQAATQITAPLDDAAIPWRLGVTTTDNGNPWCPAGTYTPEHGELVLSSCRTRMNDFLYNNGAIDSRNSGCRDFCNIDEITTVESTTASDPTPRSRPWLESVGGQTNIAGGVSMAAALACVLPQGINGCGFESQLASAQLAIARANDPSDAQHGFVEPGRLLVVVLVSDEADCSSNQQFDSIFEQEGNRVFWSDPSASFPTSAVCWNAGVQCTGDPSNYTTCTPTNFAVDGNVTDDPSLAVLLPIDELIASFGAPTIAFGILGVGPNGQPVYANTGLDPQFEDSFGIAPGCEGAAAQQAVPPARMWKVLQELGPEGQQAAYSICDPALDGALNAIGGIIASYF